MSNQLQIVLPGLFDLPLDELPAGFVERSLPRLNRLLRFASPRINRAHTVDAILGKALGLPTQASPGLPLARGFSGDDKRAHLLARAVHLRPDLSSAMIFPIETSAQDLADSRGLVADLGDLFAQDLDIAEIGEGLFLMRLESCRAPDHYPHILSVLGKSAKPYIEQSRENLEWYRLLNELQMFLHQHEINRQRLARGALPINSLWCWGGGEPRALTRSFDWYCDDAVLNRFAECLGLQPANLDALGPADRQKDGLIVDLRLLEATKSGRGVALDSLLREIEAQIFEVVLGKWRGPVWLRAGFEVDFRLGPHDQRKFWRPRQNLADRQAEYAGLRRDTH